MSCDLNHHKGPKPYSSQNVTIKIKSLTPMKNSFTHLDSLDVCNPQPAQSKQPCFPQSFSECMFTAVLFQTNNFMIADMAKHVLQKWITLYLNIQCTSLLLKSEILSLIAIN